MKTWEEIHAEVLQCALNQPHCRVGQAYVNQHPLLERELQYVLYCSLGDENMITAIIYKYQSK